MVKIIGSLNSQSGEKEKKGISGIALAISSSKDGAGRVQDSLKTTAIRCTRTLGNALPEV